MNLPPEARIFRWRPAACLRVSGADAGTFLQGQFTNDLQKLDASAGVYGLWLNQKGKTLADSFIVPGVDGDFKVVSYFSPAGIIRDRLEAYVIADDVVIEDITAETAGVTLFGAEARGRVAGDAAVFAGRRVRSPHWEFVFPMVGASATLAAAWPEAEWSPDEIERMRIRERIPAVPFDIGPTDLPNEGALEAEAISFTKGCYLGQEVMARLKSMGQVRRSLQILTGPGQSPDKLATLYQKDRKVGEVRTAVADAGKWIGLGLMSLVTWSRDEPLARAPGGPAEVSLLA